MPSAEPRVSVVMAVHNDAAFVGGAIGSVLGQSLEAIELVVVDDGSTDGTPDALAEWARRDGRVRWVRQANTGAGPARNRGMDLARAPLIALMDGDDIALPDRLARQADWLDAHPAVGLLGGWHAPMDTATGSIGEPVRLPSDPDHVRAALLFRNTISQPTVMMRRRLVHEDGYRYDPGHRVTEDYHLWARMARAVVMANLPEVLLHYRVGPTQVSARHAAEQRAASAGCWAELLAAMGLTPTAEQWACHRALAFDELDPTPAFLERANDWLLTLLRAHERTGVLPRAGMLRTLTGRWIALARLAAVHAPQTYRSWAESPFLPWVEVPLPPIR